MTTPVKVCPKCGTENRQDGISCSKCYASIANVPLAQPATVGTASAEKIDLGIGSIAPTPTRSSFEGGETYRPKPQHDEKGNGAWIVAVVVVLVILGGLMYALLPKKQIEPSVAADKVVVAFLNAKQTGDVKNVTPYLCKASVDMLNNTLNSKQARSAGFTRADAHNMVLFDVNPTKEQLSSSKINATIVRDDLADRNTVKVHVQLTPNQPVQTQQQFATGQTPQATGGTKELSFNVKDFIPEQMEFDYVLVIEGDQWKVDLHKSSQAQQNNSPMNMLLPK
ncbi:MAG: zinc ribbon domain-containing protein [Armatimonadota bacterium]|nr:zinc ribbon domain-containing protein [bacterium]